MKDPLIAQVYHIVFTENNVECQWVRVIFHNEYKFYSTNFGLSNTPLNVYQFISASTCNDHVSIFGAESDTNRLECCSV
jgi:hypothetical protein